MSKVSEANAEGSRARTTRVGVLVKNYDVADFLSDYHLLDNGNHARILNAGSASVRYGTDCLNVDIQDKPNVDVVADIQKLPDELSGFDAVICSAALQYCDEPQAAIREFRRVLKPGGLLFLDVPWIQPYCVDTPDRYRFSADAIRELLADFQILDIGPSIRTGSAFAYLGVEIARSWTRNRYINFAAAKLVGLLLTPMCYLRTARETNTAGAHYAIARKPSTAS